MKMCSVKGCKRRAVYTTKGVCRRHYDRLPRRREYAKKYKKTWGYRKYNKDYCKKKRLDQKFKKQQEKYRQQPEVKRHKREYYNQPKWKGYMKRYARTPKSRKKQREFRRKIKTIIITHYGGNPPRCACCGEGHFEFLCIDHINGDGAEHRRKIGKTGGIQFYLWLIKNKFPTGFRVLCDNCNNSLGRYGYCPHRRRGGNERDKTRRIY